MTTTQTYAGEKIYLALLCTTQKPELETLQKLFITKGNGKLYTLDGQYSTVLSVFNQLHQKLGSTQTDLWNSSFADHAAYIFASTVKPNLMLASFDYKFWAYEATATELDELRGLVNDFHDYVERVDEALSTITDFKHTFESFDADAKTPISTVLSAASVDAVNDGFKKHLFQQVEEHKKPLTEWADKHRLPVEKG